VPGAIAICQPVLAAPSTELLAVSRLPRFQSMTSYATSKRGQSMPSCRWISASAAA
jgi:hypothetical protein